MSNIQSPLIRLFEKHRIVFWYDTAKELRAEFEQLELPGVKKIEMKNNEFGIKHRVLRECFNDKFLIYHEGPEPEDLLHNWLLDVQLAQGVFRADQASLYLGELNLGPEFADLVDEHFEFFRAGQRVASLKALLAERDHHAAIRLKMLAVCTGSDSGGIDVFLEQLLGELAAGKEEKWKAIQRANLENFFWSQIEQRYGYDSATKTIRDCALTLFKECYQQALGEEYGLKNEAIIFMKRWKDVGKYRVAFETLSNQFATLLNIKQDLEKRTAPQLTGIDLFQIIDRKILFDLVQGIDRQTLSPTECCQIIQSRRQAHWFAQFIDLYEAVDHAANFLHELPQIDLKLDTFSSGIHKYSQSWFRIDQLYRNYVYHEKKSGETTLLEPLTRQIEDRYSNAFLLPLGDAWQKQVDVCTQWGSPLTSLQSDFFAAWVGPYLKSKKKVVVIVSDALRYEIGDELLRRIRTEDRYEGDLDPMVSLLPSNTQVGMAALLPHKELAIKETGALTVFADGIPTLGTPNRCKVLQAFLECRGMALQADELLDLNKERCRELIRDNEVIYVYHNRIDAAGDKIATQGRVFEAVEDTLQELVRIIKKMAGNNASNFLVTSDHGFLYQDRELTESDFSTAEVKGATISHQDRRFVVGKGLENHDSLRHFTLDQLGIKGDQEVQISKSIYRMRLKGSGSRYVHGGASLQEIVVPVVKINKKRQSDVSSVSVEIIRSSSTVITSGQLSVAFYQCEPVTEKKKPRVLKVGIYTKEGILISDSHELTFALTSEQAREREQRVRFLLTSKANQANGQTVLLKMEEQVPGTAHYAEYKVVAYTMQKSFESDFDL